MSVPASHLRESEHVDLLEGTLPSSRRAHLADCAACRQQAEELRAAMERTRDVEVPEPPPFYWEQLSARVRASVASEPPPGTAFWHRLTLTGPRLAAVAAVVSIVVAVAVWRGQAPATGDGAATSRPAESASSIAERPEDDGFGDIEADENWALVRTVADDLSFDAIDAEGIAPRPGSAEALAYSMSEMERIALAQILEDEMKRSKRREAAS
jgi:hypothetical protein